MADLLNLLQRYSDDGQSTLGLLFSGSQYGLQFMCYTLEDERREIKVPGDTRIPAGRYEMKLRQALSPLTEKYRQRFPWFTWHVEVTGVPGFQNVYLHVGNKDGDTEGCILLGDTANNNVMADGFIGGSAGAYERWYEIVAGRLAEGGRVFLEVRDEPAILKVLA